MHSPDSGVDPPIPPIPPIPQSLSSVLSHTRHLSTEVAQKTPSRSQSLRIVRLPSQTSKRPEPPSLASVTTSPSDNPTPASTEKSGPGDDPRPPLPQPLSNRSTSHENPSNHSLSNPSSLPHNSSPNLDATSGLAAVSIRRSQPPPSLDLPSPSAVTDDEDSLRPHPTLSDNQDEPQRTAATSNTARTEKTVGSATSGEDITKVLTAYRFVSPLKSSFPVHLYESPDPPMLSLSPWSGGSRSHRTDTNDSVSLPQTPNSANKRPQNGASLFVIQNSSGLTPFDCRS